MNTILALVFVLATLYGVYLFRVFVSENLEYKRTRMIDFKRRMQVEVKADAMWHERFKTAENNGERIAMELQANRERHERTVKYLIADMFESGK